MVSETANKQSQSRVCQESFLRGRFPLRFLISARLLGWALFAPAAFTLGAAEGVGPSVPAAALANAKPSPTPAPPTLTGMTVVTAPGGAVVAPFINGYVYDLKNSLSVRADPGSNVASVSFQLDGVVIRTDNGEPYSVAGDNRTTYTAWRPTLGSHTLIAIPFSKTAGGGTAGAAVTVSFTVVNTGTTPSPTPSPTPTATPTPTPTPTSTPTPSPTTTPTPTPTATPVGSTVRINCGGPNYNDTQNHLWSADNYFTGGTALTFTQSISGTSDPTLYQSERFAPTLTYQIPVPNGSYEVTLCFAELYWTSAGKRVFNVALQGQTVLQNFDIYALVGANTALQRTFQVLVTNGVLSIVGTASVDNAKFSAIQIVPPPSVSFASPVTVGTLTSPTQAAWGPDGRLYVGSDQGNITIYTFSDDYTVTNVQTVTTIAGLSNKAILGLAFNPGDPPNPVKIYVGHARLYAEGGGSFTGPAPYNGQISVLTGPNFLTVQPLITNLPVSNADHAINGITFNNEGDLLIANGGNTNAGIPGTLLGTLPESPLSAAILRARITKPGFNGSINYIETATGLQNNDQVYGDRVDVAPGVDMSVFAPGFRNCFDIVWTTQGRLYSSDNGPNGGYGAASTSATTQGPDPDAPDEINYVVEGHYYGHPNRNRGRYDDRQNVYHLPTDGESYGQYNGSPMAIISPSSDGIEEYRATIFNSAMRGNLLVQHWNGELYRAVLAPDGRSVQSVTTLFQPLGLDVVAGPGGAILSADYSNNRLLVLKPIDSGATGVVAYDIFPWRGRADGTVPFVVGGIGFGSLGNTTVTIGGVAATLSSVTSTRIKGTVPAVSSPSAQLLDVTVQSAGQVSTISQAFRYVQGQSNGTGIWKTGATSPASVGEVACGVVNGILYLVGEGPSATFAYDLKAGVWRSNLAVRPYVGDHHSAEVIKNKLYVFGGLDSGQGQVQIYNPVTNSWSLGTPMPWAAGSVSTALIGGKVYAAGGIVNGITVNTAGVYDPVNNTWTLIAPEPVGRNHAAGGTDGSKFYIFGGRSGGNAPDIGFNDVQIYDPTTNTWQWSGSPGSKIPPLPQARGGMGHAPFYGNELYVMGGETTDAGTGQVTGNVYNRVDVYNPVTRTWRLEAVMPTARHGIFPVAADGKILVGGGGIQAGGSTSAVFELFFR